MYKYLLFLVLIPSVIGTVEISEVMYNPKVCSDTYCEWVELHNNANHSANLSTCYFQNKKLTSVLEPYQYHILARNVANATHHFNITSSIEKVSFSLPNKGKKLILNGTCDDFVDYSNYLIDEGYSIEKRSTGEWKQSLQPKGTPGSANSNRNDCNIKLSFTNFNLISNSSSFSVKATKINGDPTITVRGLISDINGKRITSYSPWTNKKLTTSLQKSYKPRLKEGPSLITFWLENSSCHNVGSNNISRLLYILPKPTKITSKKSSIEIEKVGLGPDNYAQWGESISTTIKAYKTNTSKTVIYTYLKQGNKRISEKTKFYLLQKNQDTKITIPLQIHPRCTEQTKSKAILVVEGINTKDTKEITLKGFNKKTCPLKSSSKPLSPKISYNLSIPPNSSVLKPFIVSLQVNSNTKTTLTAWAYLYRGSRCYSCNNNTQERSYNNISLNLNNQSKNISFLLLPDQRIEPGYYNIMVKTQEKGKKTINSVKGEVELIAPMIKTKTLNTTFIPKVSPTNKTPNKTINPPTKLTGAIIYESTSQKSHNKAPILIVILFILVLIITLRKERTMVGKP